MLIVIELGNELFEKAVDYRSTALLSSQKCTMKT